LILINDNHEIDNYLQFRANLSDTGVYFRLSN